MGSSPLTRGQTPVPCIGSAESCAPGPPGKSLYSILFIKKCPLYATKISSWPRKGATFGKTWSRIGTQEWKNHKCQLYECLTFTRKRLKWFSKVIIAVSLPLGMWKNSCSFTSSLPRSVLLQFFILANLVCIKGISVWSALAISWEELALDSFLITFSQSQWTACSCSPYFRWFFKVLIEQFATHSIMFCSFNAGLKWEDYFFKNGLRFKKLYLVWRRCKKKTGTLFLVYYWDSSCLPLSGVNLHQEHQL